jgi:hypothetical protein
MSTAYGNITNRTHFTTLRNGKYLYETSGKLEDKFRGAQLALEFTRE